MNHPETIGPDPHTPGSPLPRANFVNDVGYLPDGTPLNKATKGTSSLTCFDMVDEKGFYINISLSRGF